MPNQTSHFDPAADSLRATRPVVCVTGGARRIGRALVLGFHGAGFDVVIHYHQSQSEAQDLLKHCLALRPDSAALVQGDLEATELDKLAEAIEQCFGRLDILVHNASRFFATPIGQITPSDWQRLMDSNARAPLFLTQALLAALRQGGGSVISLLDIHADNRPFVGYSVYNMAKAAHRMLVQSLALELAPHIRVNGIAPGVNVLPDHDSEQALPKAVAKPLLASIPLGRAGTPEDIVQAALFLAQASYVTGQILAVDGGRSLTLAGMPPIS